MEEGAQVGTKEKEKTKVKINGSNQEQGIGQHAFEISGTNKIRGKHRQKQPLLLRYQAWTVRKRACRLIMCN